ncbi:MAG: MOSC domain-containing protein [Acidimicrobiales bacterium]
MPGTVISIFTAAASGEPTIAHQNVRAVAGRGLEGDRYFESNAGDHDPEDEITLIAAEGIGRAKTEHGVELEPGEHRRNVVVEGVDLSAYVGEKIRVGAVEVEVIKPNPPCRYLTDLTGKPMLAVLRGAGGVRGRILTDGTIRVGDQVEPLSTS